MALVHGALDDCIQRSTSGERCKTAPWHEISLLKSSNNGVSGRFLPVRGMRISMAVRQCRSALSHPPTEPDCFQIGTTSSDGTFSSQHKVGFRRWSADRLGRDQRNHRVEARLAKYGGEPSTGVDLLMR